MEITTGSTGERAPVRPRPVGHDRTNATSLSAARKGPSGDDRPEGNRAERRFLRAAGVTVVNVVDTAEALAELARDDYDVVITDVHRPEGTDAGLVLAKTLHEGGFASPVIAYVGSVDAGAGVPVGLRAITARPDELIQQVFDVVERLDGR